MEAIEREMTMKYQSGMVPTEQERATERATERFPSERSSSSEYDDEHEDEIALKR
jgi:hypothetical protein